MGLLGDLINTAIRKNHLKKRYQNDKSRGFHDEKPWGEWDRAGSACYLQSPLRSFGKEKRTLKIVAPEEAVIPRGWTSIWGDYALVDLDGKLYGTLVVQNMRYLGVEIGDYVTAERMREDGEYFLAVYNRYF